jgi:crotonobetainyl-CoA:carnitine CoA-transferase CaiB-like acyl-CoA transferase
VISHSVWEEDQMQLQADMPMLMRGYRALDLTDEKGFLCGQILGGLGVDVIKIIGNRVYNAPSYHLSKTSNHIFKAGPCLGEENEYVYKEILGYTDDNVAEFMVDGVITTEHDLPGASEE